MSRKTKEKEERSPDPDGLNDRQLAFIDHYLGDCKLNASKAALAAGYAHRTEAFRLLANPIIRARIDEYLAGLAKTRDEVLEMLVDDALIDVDDELTAIERRLKRRKATALDPATRASIASGLLSARSSARANLAKAYGLFSDRQGAGAAIEIHIEGVDTEKL